MMTLRFHFFLMMIWSCSVSEDVDVSCGFLESCVLPCVFTPGDDPLIHWIKEPGDTPVYNYFKNQHQLHLQHENYTDRTFLSDQGISTGDASLQLHKVKVHDEGRYKCYISTIRPDNVKESFVNVKVYGLLEAEALPLTRPKADVDVSCVFLESCVLPCVFTPGDDPVIHWTKEPGDIPVRIYYKNKHQLHLQHENYTDRTSLSDQGISTGDASLQLHKVKVCDEGRYECYVNTIRPDNVKECFVNLKVYAPVLDVSVHQEGQELICRAERIYPEPTVAWTPPSSDSYQTQPLVNTTEDGLYSVYSSVRLPPNSAGERVTCNISTPCSWGNATVTPTGDAALFNHNLHNPWIWTLFLILLFIIVVLLMHCHWWKKSRSLEAAHFGAVPSNDPKMNHDDERRVNTELNDTSVPSVNPLILQPPTIIYVNPYKMCK